ncbi:hypothetical protein M8C21_007007 [Ambrosia artemisiifolia]|uniref:Uncharacterized protein n=1 Tax=Ambrosia artemisiifolia TaxID=4212 RepID=A0AAD5CRA6_AMBAR|nr:hypothetical protein M8C21_007007 [Ambrosia artemisiifolia]
MLGNLDGELMMDAAQIKFGVIALGAIIALGVGYELF